MKQIIGLIAAGGLGVLLALLFFLFGKKRTEKERERRRNEAYLQAVFDTEPNILVTTSGDRIDRANIKMLEFTGYPDMESFRKEHSSICDFFQEEPGYLYREMEGMSWLEYIHAHPDRLHKAVIRKGGEERVFLLHANRLTLDEERRSLVVFSDITPLEEARKRTDLYLATAQVMLLALDKNGTVTMLNPKGQEVLGWSEEELVGKNWFDCCIPEGVREEVKGVFARCLRPGQTMDREHENEILRKDGVARLIRWRNARLENRAGETIGVLSSGEDITERKEAQERLHLFRILLDHSDDAIEILDPPTLRFLDVNEASCRSLGYAREELLAMTVYHIDPLFTPEMAERVRKRMQKSGSVRFEGVHRRKDGSTFPVEINTTLVELERPYILSIARDITERKTAANALEESESRFRAIFDGATDGILLVDVETRKFTAGNARICAMLGYGPEELTSLGVEEIHPREELPYVLEQFGKQVRQEVSLAANLPVQRKDGSLFFADVNSFPILLGGKTYLAGFFRDITERKKMEAELQRREELMIAQSRQAAMGEMIGMIAHQWRQPISTIGMAANNLLLDIEMSAIDPEEFKTTLETVNRQVKHLSKTIDDFRNFFRPQQEREGTTLPRVMEQTLEIIGKSLENNDIAVEKSYRSQRTLLTYPRELIQVFLNLLGNAKEALLERKVESARIAIAVTETDREILATICDNGGGIGEKDRKRIFEPYFTTKKQTGTGLGLYMSRTIVEKHLGGTLVFADENGGACFTVALPLETWEEQEPPASGP